MSAANLSADLIDLAFLLIRCSPGLIPNELIRIESVRVVWVSSVIVSGGDSG